MSGGKVCGETRFRKPLTHITGYAYRPRQQVLILDCVREGRAFPIKIDLRLAGSGVYTYDKKGGVMLLARGVVGKPREQQTWRDFMKRPLGALASSREVAEALLALCAQKHFCLDGWPVSEGVQPAQSVAESAD